MIRLQDNLVKAEDKLEEAAQNEKQAMLANWSSPVEREVSEKKRLPLNYWRSDVGGGRTALSDCWNAATPRSRSRDRLRSSRPPSPRCTASVLTHLCVLRRESFLLVCPVFLFLKAKREPEIPSWRTRRYHTSLSQPRSADKSSPPAHDQASTSVAGGEWELRALVAEAEAETLRKEASSLRYRLSQPKEIFEALAGTVGVGVGVDSALQSGGVGVDSALQCIPADGQAILDARCKAHAHLEASLFSDYYHKWTYVL